MTSRDVTMAMPIQGTVCNPNAKPSPAEPVYKIWSFSRSGYILGETKNLNKSRP